MELTRRLGLLVVGSSLVLAACPDSGATCVEACTEWAECLGLDAATIAGDCDAVCETPPALDACATCVRASCATVSSGACAAECDGLETARLPLTIDLTRKGAGTGTITSDPTGIDCLQTCSASFPSGTVTLHATPSSNGATFEGWSGACTGKNDCTVTRVAGMDANQAVTATFGQVYAGTFSGSGTITRPVTYGTCTWNSSWTGTATIHIVGWDSGQLVGDLRIVSTRTDPVGTPSDSRQTCLSGSASYDDFHAISGTPSELQWAASPMQGSSFLSSTFQGAMSGNVGMMGGDSVSGTLRITASSPASGGATIPITMSR